MNRQITAVAVPVLLGLVALHIGFAQDFRLLSNGAPTNVENFAQEAFSVAQSSGSVVLRGTCAATNVSADVVSDILAHPPQGPFHDIGDALTALSRVAPHLSWLHDEQGLLRVHDDRVRDDVLRIRLQRVHFKGAPNPDAAIWEVLSSPEVRAYFKVNHIGDGLVFNNLAPASTKGLPRLSGDLHDVTVAEALDHVMRFFPGVWIYSECPIGSSRRVMVRGFAVRFPNATVSGGTAQP